MERSFRLIKDKTKVAEIEAKMHANYLLEVPADLDVQNIQATDCQRLRDLFRDQNEAFMKKYPIGSTITVKKKDKTGKDDETPWVISFYINDPETKIPFTVRLQSKGPKGTRVGENSIFRLLQTCEITVLDLPIDESFVQRAEFHANVFNNVIPRLVMPRLKALSSRKTIDLTGAEKMIVKRFERHIQEKWRNTSAPLSTMSDQELEEIGMQFFEQEYGFRD